MKNRIFRALNILLYNYWLRELALKKFIEKTLSAIASPLLYLFPSKIRLKIRNRVAKNTANSEWVWNDKVCGFGISLAKSTYWVVFGLPLELLIGTILFTFIVAGLDIGDKSLMIIFVSASLLFAYPLDKAIEKDRYLEYFKEFEKKDKQWHRKWKRISIIFSISMLLSMPLMILYMIAIQHI